MFFNKYTFLVLSALTSVAAVHVNRDLTVCPTDYDVGLTCIVYLDADGGGQGPWEKVGEVIAPDTLNLDSFDPAGCYNIFCESTDTLSWKRLKWFGYINRDGTIGQKTSSKVPYWLSGNTNGNGCTKLGTSCEDLDITLQATRTPSPGATDLSKYICAEAKIECISETPTASPTVSPVVSATASPVVTWTPYPTLSPAVSPTVPPDCYSRVSPTGPTVEPKNWFFGIISTFFERLFNFFSNLLFGGGGSDQSNSARDRLVL